MAIDATHDPHLLAWLPSANDADTPFPPQNLPLGRFWAEDRARVGVAIGDQVLEVGAAQSLGLLQLPVALGDDLRALAPFASELRRQLSAGLCQGSGWETYPKLLRPQAQVQMLLPFEGGEYTDFYASIHHATRVGSMFRPDNPLLPNYKHVPIGYHGRASTLIVSGSEIFRPSGQLKADADPAPVYGPCKQLDYELEVGLWVGRENPRGTTVPISQAGSHLLGVCLLNDWSARDIQRWEYQPLGPFLAKSFATSVSPWVITRDALEPFRSPGPTRPPDDPTPLDYLCDPSDVMQGMFDIHLEVQLTSAQMRSQGLAPVVLSSSNLRDLYWTPAQLITHHASNGCRLRVGDLLASGTVSGPDPASAGCLLELTWPGPGQARRPITLPSGEERIFLQNGDQVSLTGSCQRIGFRTIGLGQCLGTIASLT